MYIHTYLWLINTFTFRGFTAYVFFIDYNKGGDIDTFFGLTSMCSICGKLSYQKDKQPYQNLQLNIIE